MCDFLSLNSKCFCQCMWVRDGTTSILLHAVMVFYVTRSLDWRAVDKISKNNHRNSWTGATPCSLTPARILLTL